MTDWRVMFDTGHHARGTHAPDTSAAATIAAANGKRRQQQRRRRPCQARLGASAMRHAQWDARLVALVAKHRTTPYAWGTHDCLTFAADAVKAVTGKDHAKGHRGKYKSHASAMVYLQHLGADTPEDYLDLLFDDKPVGFAQRGDLVMADNGIPMLCMGAFAISVGSEGNFEGLVKVPRSAWTKAWAI